MPSRGPVDEERRRAFERHRLGGGADALEAFLPPVAEATYGATLEELVLIDLEVRRRAWTESGRVGAAPGLDEYAARHPLLGEADVAARLARELDAMDGDTPSAAAGAAGARIGRHVLVERLGRGAFAEVWRARDPKLRRDVALKLLRPELVSDAGARDRLLREARSAARLHHPSIVPVHEVVEEDGRLVVVAELIEGPTLAAEIARRRFTPQEAARIVAPLADALEYAHECGVVHRDVKPANVLLASGGRPVLTDFGLARLSAAESVLTQAGDVLGTPAYMAPEQARGELGAVGPRSDVYALGAVLYELLCGKPPFEGATASVLYAVAHVDPEPPRSRADVPGDIETICLVAMAKEPDRRYASAAAMAEDLRRFLDLRPIAARRPGPVARALLWTRRNPLAAGSIAAGVVAVAVVAAVAFNRVVEERDRFRSERDRSQANLRRALETQAEALLEARDTGWYGKATEALRQAAEMRQPGDDATRLRDLVLRAESAPYPSFEPAGAWRDDEPAVALAACAAAERVHGVTATGRLWTRDSRDGKVLRERRVDGTPTCLAVDPAGRRLVVGTRAGAHVLDAETLDAARATLLSDAHVVAAVFPPAGAELALATADGRVEVRAEAGDGAPTALEAPEGGVRSLAFSLDGRSLAGGGRALVRLWDWRSGTSRTSRVGADVIRSIVFHGDEQVSAAAAETFGFDQVSLRRASGLIPYHRVHDAAVRQLMYDPRQARGLLTASADGTITCFGLPTQPMATARGGFAPIASFAAAGASGRIWAAHDDGSLRAWDFVEPPLRTLFVTAHRAAFVPGTSRLATHDAAIDLDRTPPLRTPYKAVGVTALAVDEEGRTWAGRDDGSVRKWFSSAGPVDVLGPTGLRVTSLAFGVDCAVAAGIDGALTMVARDGASSRVDVGLGPIHAIAFLEDGKTVGVVAQGGLAAVSPGGKRIVDRLARPWGAIAVHGAVVAVSDDVGGVEIRGGNLGTRLRVLAGHGVAVTGLAFSADGGQLASVAPDEDVRVWNSADWTEAASLRAPTGSVHHVAFGPTRGALTAIGPRGGQVIDVASRRVLGTIDVADVAALQMRLDTVLIGTRGGSLWSLNPPSVDAPGPLTPRTTLLSGGHFATVWGVATSPDGRLIATSSHVGGVKLVDARSLSPLHDVETRGDLAWDAAFSNDSAWLAAGSGNDVLIWRIIDQGGPTRLSGHTALVTSLVFEGSETLWSASHDGSIRAWGVKSWERKGTLVEAGPAVLALAVRSDRGTLVAGTRAGELLVFVPADAPFPRPPNRRVQLGSPVWAVAFNEKGDTLAAGLQDGRVVLLDPSTLATRLVLDAGARSIRSLSFGGGGRFLAAGAYGKTSVAWDLDGLRVKLWSLGLDADR